MTTLLKIYLGLQKVDSNIPLSSKNSVYLSSVTVNLIFHADPMSACTRVMQCMRPSVCSSYLLYFISDKCKLSCDIADNRCISCTNPPEKSQTHGNVAKCTQNVPFFKVNEETSNYLFASLSPSIYLPSCEAGRIPWRRMDIKIHNT